MSTFKQKMAIQKTLVNGGNVTLAMREAGYSETTIHNPSNLTGSKGFKDLLRVFGLDEGFVVCALVEDIRKKPQNRVRELILASELLGLKKRASTIEIEEKELPVPILQIYSGLICKKEE